MRTYDEIETLYSLEKLFRPQAVAIVGASVDPGKLSGIPLRNLIRIGYKGRIFPINPKEKSIDGIKCYQSLKDVNEPIDVAMICLPAEKAVLAVEECLELKIPAAIVAVSGFGEVGTSKGKQLQEKLSALAKKGIRIVGPNCNGIYNIHDRISIGYNVTHGWKLDKGSIAVLSHSGALFSSIVSLGSTFGKGLGFSYFISAGNESDLNLNDYMEYMVNDDNTQIIALILDRIDQIEKFKSLCRRAHSIGKHIVALKIGNSETGIQATLAHSARLSGSARSYKKLLEECGVFQVDNLEALVGVCAVLDKYSLCGKSGLSGFSTSGAGCAVMADTAEQYGLTFPILSENTLKIMKEITSLSTPMNPYDIAGNTNALSILSEYIAQDEKVGFILFYSTILQTEKFRMGMATNFSKECNRLNRFPFLVIAPGPLSTEENKIYQENDIIVFNNAHLAFQVIKAINDTIIHKNVNSIEETNTNQEIKSERAKANNAIEFFKHLDIPQPKQVFVNTPDELYEASLQIGFPVVIKGISKEHTHKSDKGLVWLNVKSKDDIEKIHQLICSYQKKGLKFDSFQVQEFVSGEIEVLIGINKDPEVGYVLILGSGGKYVEVYDDIELCLIPATREKIEKAFLSTKAGRILNGYRNNGLSLEQVVDIAYRLQEIVQFNDIKSIDLNPVIANPKKAIAVDVRIL
jgi:acetate---CoA ligase (ADP-forming)